MPMKKDLRKHQGCERFRATLNAMTCGARGLSPTDTGVSFFLVPLESLRPDPGSPKEISGARDDKG